jgi:hypothetical protein
MKLPFNRGLLAGTGRTVTIIYDNAVTRLPLDRNQHKTFKLVFLNNELDSRKTAKIQT